jgi:tryptophan-rich sensory protein
MSFKKFGQLVIAIGVCELAGVVGSLFTLRAIPDWYSTLQKPLLNPPSWIFGPVWTTLYALMGLSAFLVYQKGWKRKEVKFALGVFGAQLFLNALWSILFFGLHNPLAALIEIFLLWLAIVWTILSFYKVSRLAAYLLIPYILWVSFAIYLNGSIVWLN